MIFQVLSDSSGKEFIDSYSSFIEKRSEAGFIKMMTLKVACVFTFCFFFVGCLCVCVCVCVCVCFFL
jgi:hypothetical protein